MTPAQLHQERVTHIAEILSEDEVTVATRKALELLDGVAPYLTTQYGAKISACELYRAADRMAVLVPSKFDWSKTR